jgi:hypothetical protein
MILIAYTLAGLIEVPSREIGAQLPGFYFEIQINIQNVVLLLVSALAISGTDWLISEHPSFQNRQRFQHWLIPALTAGVIGLPLIQGALGTFWWFGILLGGSVLIFVLGAEYVAVDPADKNFPIASIGLSAIGYALFFLLAITLRASELRLFLIVPALTLAMILITLRTLSFRVDIHSPLQIVAVCTLIVAEMSVAAHYLPLSPIGYGLFMLGTAYGATNFIINFESDYIHKKMLVEPLIIVILFWVSALWVG